LPKRGSNVPTLMATEVPVFQPAFQTQFESAIDSSLQYAEVDVLGVSPRTIFAPTMDAGTQVPSTVQQSPKDWKHRLKSIRNHAGAILNRAGLEREDFTVLSNDCWGHALYEELGLPLRTPFIGSGMHADCFLRFLADIEGYLSSPLKFAPDSSYASVRRLRKQRHAWPVGLLRGEVEIHFLHSYSEEESRRIWEAGCESVNLNRIAVKFSSHKDGASQQHIDQFAALPFERKLLIAPQPLPDIACAIHTPDYVINGAVMFRRSLKRFDCAHWLNTGEILRNTPRVMLNKIIFARGV
jgi:uncharacterized protein (DUF1919 family)